MPGWYKLEGWFDDLQKWYKLEGGWLMICKGGISWVAGSLESGRKMFMMPALPTPTPIEYMLPFNPQTYRMVLKLLASSLHLRNI